MAFDVKITKFKRFAEIICPHYCISCGKIGGILCDSCKNYNIFEHMNYCLKCGVVIKNGSCEHCESDYDASWCLGAKKEVFGELAMRLKYDSVRAAALPLAEMLNSILPYWRKVTLVPVPTLRRHVRQRGLDHTRLVAKYLAKMRTWRLESLISRVTDTVQVGAGVELRRRQADKAYSLNKNRSRENLSSIRRCLYDRI